MLFLKFRIKACQHLYFISLCLPPAHLNLNPYFFRLGHLPKFLPHLLPEIVSETTTSHFYAFICLVVLMREEKGQKQP